MTMLLQGVVGSTAYGLDTPDSDIDRLAVFAAPTEEVLGLHPPRDSVVTTKPDITRHEARKFVKLVLNGNPSVSELLWLNDYELISDLGHELIDIRRAFLSAGRVRDAYMGYAVSQFNRLLSRGDGSFSADTRKRTPGTLAHREDMQQVRTGETSQRVREEPPEGRRSGEQMPGVSPGDAYRGVRPESGAVPRGIEEAEGALAEQRHSGSPASSASEADVRRDAGAGGGAADRAGGRVPDLRGSGGSGGSLSCDGKDPGAPLSEVQQGPGSLRGQRAPADESSGVPLEVPDPALRERRRVEKHARHLVRLVEQGFHLYVTGDLVVDLRSSVSEVEPSWIHEMGRRIADEPKVAAEYMVEATKRFDGATAALPDKPNEGPVQDWLISVRREYWR